MKNILLVLVFLFPVPVFSEILRVVYNYQSNSLYSPSAYDLLFKNESRVKMNEILITSSDGAIVKSKTVIPKMPYQLSFHVDLKTKIVTLYDKANNFSVEARNPTLVYYEDQEYTAFSCWNRAEEMEQVKMGKAKTFSEAPNILNQVNSAITSYLGNNSYKIIKSIDGSRANGCDYDPKIGFLCSNTFLEVYRIETTNDGNLTCENCKKTDDLDKMNGNVLKITDKLAKQEEIKKENPVVITAKDDSIKKEPKKEINLNENAEHIPIGSTLTFSRNIFYQDKRIMIEISKTSNEVAMCYMTFEEVSKNNSSIPKDTSFTIKRVNKLNEGDYNIVSFNFSTDESKNSGIQCLQEKVKPDMKIIDIVNSLKSFGIIIKMP